MECSEKVVCGKSIDDNLQGSIIDLIIDGERYPALEHFGGQFKEVTSLHFKIKHS